MMSDMKEMRNFLLLLCAFLAPVCVYSQVENDTFFLAKKKGLIGKLGMSISTFDKETAPVLTVNPYLRYAGKKIRDIEIVGLGLHEYVPDTVVPHRNFVDKVADAFHLNTRKDVIEKNLFFKKGDRVYPFELSDNERFLREQDFIRDALIVVLPDVEDTNQVYISVLVRDVFSLGGSASGKPFDELDVEVKDENIFGTGNRVSLYGLYDEERKPQWGYGFEYLQRNIRGSFWNWNLGMKTYEDAFNSGRAEELDIFTGFQRELYSRYTLWTGEVDVHLKSTKNYYIKDSLFKSDYQYKKFESDAWLGLNIGANKAKLTDKYSRIRHFVALRGFYNHYFELPKKYQQEYHYNYADFKGMLAGYTMYRQNFYKTSFIYGFGRQEDVPVGFSVSLLGGYTIKQNRERPYYGMSSEGSVYSKKGNYYTGYVRVGGYRHNRSWEDIDFLIGVEQITKLRKIAPNWRNRGFMSVAFAKQVNPLLNTPLFIDSDYGMPYFNKLVEGNMRLLTKTELAFYHLKRFWGFRIAPFVFGDWTLMTPVNEAMKHSNGYTAFGGGFRTRNENLIFGTIELKGYYFPRTVGDMKNFKIDISTNVRFRYNSRFVKKPEFVLNN